MDSINRRQPEDNYEDLQGPEAQKKIRELTGKASTCFFCTRLQTGKPFATRPMAIQQVDDVPATCSGVWLQATMNNAAPNKGKSFFILIDFK